MRYKVVHVSDLSDRQLAEIQLKLKAGVGPYFVLDFSGNPYGRYLDFDDAQDHADTLNEAAEL